MKIWKWKGTIRNTKKNTKTALLYSLLFWEVIYFFSSPCIIITSSCIVFVVTCTIVFSFICGSVHIHPCVKKKYWTRARIAKLRPNLMRREKEKKKKKKNGTMRKAIYSDLYQRRKNERWIDWELGTNNEENYFFKRFKTVIQNERALTLVFVNGDS